MLRNILTAAAALALVAGASAQTQYGVLHKAENAQFAGIYRPDTGFVSANPAGRSGPDVIWNNNALSNYYSVPGALQEWVDEGALADRGIDNNEQCNGFDFTYCSYEPDATSNSGSGTYNFYDETTYCGGPTNYPTADCSYGIAGLPLGDANGNTQCWIVGVDLTGGYECNLSTDDANGKLFANSMTWDQGSTGPWLASGGYGNLDAFVWYDTTTGANVGCYWFGGIPFAGFACGMAGTADDTQAYYSSAPGAADFVQMSSTAVAAGGSATWTVDNPGAGMNYSILAAMSSAEISVLGGTCLVGYPNLIGGTPRVMAGGSFSTTVPALAGDVYTQAVEHTGSSASGATVTGFSNGLVHHF